MLSSDPLDDPSAIVVPSELDIPSVSDVLSDPTAVDPPDSDAVSVAVDDPVDGSVVVIDVVLVVAPPDSVIADVIPPELPVPGASSAHAATSERKSSPRITTLVRMSRSVPRNHARAKRSATSPSSSDIAVGMIVSSKSKSG